MVVLNSLKKGAAFLLLHQQTQLIIIWSRVHLKKLRQSRNSTPSTEAESPLLCLYICYWFISWATWNQSPLSNHISSKYVPVLYSHLHCVPSGLVFMGGETLWTFPLPYATVSTCLPPWTFGFNHHKLWKSLLSSFMLSPATSKYSHQLPIHKTPSIQPLILETAFHTH